MKNILYYGDNLRILRDQSRVATASVDLCYIDPPFNSKRTYNQIYNNAGREDRAQAQAFIDTWVWDDEARDGYRQIASNHEGRFMGQTIDLINGLHSVLGEGSLCAYIVSMTLRIVEIHRILKKSGTFYLHCNPTAGHYLKLALDSVFVTQGGEFRNEIIWCYRGGGVPRSDFARKHQTVFRYSKSDKVTFNVNEVRIPYSEDVTNSLPSRYDKSYRDNKIYEGYKPNPMGKHPEDWWPIQPLMPSDTTERLGYPTQKPKKLMERIIKASSNAGDLILDAYCGCGTTIAVAQELNRQWTGIDITYQAIATVLGRLEDEFGEDVAKAIRVDGIPSDLDSARALAHRRDDRLRKEFEKWAILTYTNNRAVIRQKKGADGGIDGLVYFFDGDYAGKMILQVKSGNVERKDIAALRGDLERTEATLACLITLESPSRPMVENAKAAGVYENSRTNFKSDRIRIITIEDLIHNHARIELSMDIDSIRKANLESEGQLTLNLKSLSIAEKPKATSIKRVAKKATEKLPPVAIQDSMPFMESRKMVGRAR